MVDSIDIAAVDLCASIYDSSAITAWNYYDDGSDDGVCWGLIELDGVWYVCFRGSVTAPDWWDDLEAIAEFDKILQAYVHPGFNRGIWRVWQKVKTLIPSGAEWVACGHSLGAARADNLVAYAVMDKMPPVKRVVFGEPKPGFSDFADIVDTVDGESYRNCDTQGHDIVTDVPVRILVEKYEPPCPPISVSQSPDPRKPLDPFDYHHIQLYRAALHNMLMSPAPVAPSTFAQAQPDG